MDDYKRLKIKINKLDEKRRFLLGLPKSEGLERRLRAIYAEIARIEGEIADTIGDYEHYDPAFRYDEE